MVVARRFGVTDQQHYRRSRCCKRHAVLKEMLLVVQTKALPREMLLLAQRKVLPRELLVV